MIDILIWTALTMSIGPTILAVWVFAHLNAGYIIVGDSYNLMELGLSITILIIVVVAQIGFVVRRLRK